MVSSFNNSVPKLERKFAKLGAHTFGYKVGWLRYPQIFKSNSNFEEKNDL